MAWVSYRSPLKSGRLDCWCSGGKSLEPQSRWGRNHALRALPEQVSDTEREETEEGEPGSVQPLSAGWRTQVAKHLGIQGVYGRGPE